MATTKNSKKPETAASHNGDTGVALHGLAKSIDNAADELRPLYHLEVLADNLAELARGMNHLADVQALNLIATYGTPQDQQKIVEHLKEYNSPFKWY